MRRGTSGERDISWHGTCAEEKGKYMYHVFSFSGYLSVMD